jgi:hypothetical protein
MTLSKTEQARRAHCDRQRRYTERKKEAAAQRAAADRAIADGIAEGRRRAEAAQEAELVRLRSFQQKCIVCGTPGASVDLGEGKRYCWKHGQEAMKPVAFLPPSPGTDTALPDLPKLLPGERLVNTVTDPNKPPFWDDIDPKGTELRVQMPLVPQAPFRIPSPEEFDEEGGQQFQRLPQEGMLFSEGEGHREMDSPSRQEREYQAKVEAFSHMSPGTFEHARAMMAMQRTAHERTELTLSRVPEFAPSFDDVEDF